MTELLYDTERNAEISRRLTVIRRYYDLDALCAHKTEAADVAAYYRASDFFYNHIHARGGRHIHMGLSEDALFHEEDFLGQANTVASHITQETDRILEIGAGRLANTKYLAERFPQIAFYALDLPDRRFLRGRAPKNVRRTEGDFHDLSCFEPGSFDIVFGVETVCHGEDKQKIFRECFRVLKPGGRLILFDVYEPQPRDRMSEFEIFVSRTTLAAMRVTGMGQYIGDSLEYLTRAGFAPPEVTDLTERIRPTLRRLERLSGAYFRRPGLIRAIRKIIPEDAAMNSIAGWLMNLTFDGKTIHQYNRVLAVKPPEPQEAP